jgi:hypothetical protein
LSQITYTGGFRHARVRQAGRDLIDTFAPDMIVPVTRRRSQGLTCSGTFQTCPSRASHLRKQGWDKLNGRLEWEPERPDAAEAVDLHGLQQGSEVGVPIGRAKLPCEAADLVVVAHMDQR